LTDPLGLSISSHRTRILRGWRVFGRDFFAILVDSTVKEVEHLLAETKLWVTEAQSPDNLVPDFQQSGDALRIGLGQQHSPDGLQHNRCHLGVTDHVTVEKEAMAAPHNLLERGGGAVAVRGVGRPCSRSLSYFSVMCCE
jgi:hypothetical protein